MKNIFLFIKKKKRNRKIGVIIEVKPVIKPVFEIAALKIIPLL